MNKISTSVITAFSRKLVCPLLMAIFTVVPAYASILDEDPLAWKLSVNVGEDKLRISSIWFEYAKFDEGITLDNGPRAFNDDPWFFSFGSNEHYFSPQEMDIWHLAARQNWGKSGFSTFERYARYDIDQNSYNEWGVGVGYRYNQKLYFEVAYNDQQIPLQNDEHDRQLRFRTMISF